METQEIKEVRKVGREISNERIAKVEIISYNDYEYTDRETRERVVESTHYSVRYMDADTLKRARVRKSVCTNLNTGDATMIIYSDEEGNEVVSGLACKDTRHYVRA